MIGVIAALTLPTLMNSTNEKEIVARVKKVHAMLNEAYGRAYAKYGPFDTWYSSSDTIPLQTKRIGTRITEFLQVEKNCGTGVTDCIKKYSTIAPAEYTTYSLNGPEYYSVILSGGTSVAFYCNASHGHCNIWIDLDGPKKGKATLGTDIFYFILSSDKNRIFAVQEGVTGDACRAGDVNACTGWILANGNADYINCGGLTESNPTCN